MFLTPYAHLKWAYQLHYHLCFRTYRRRPFYAGETQRLKATFDCLFGRYGYHPLETKLRASDVQLLLSLRPDHRISDVLKKLKGESSSILCPQLAIEPPLWARGYLARTTGRVRLRAVKEYLNRQAEHHGYGHRALTPVFRFRSVTPIVLSVAHASFDLKHHIVLATTFRKPIFDARLGEFLVNYWLKVADKRGFALDQATVLPDHVHMLVRIMPKMSIEECALLLMNNGQHFIATNFPERIIEAGINQLWQPSAYVGTCGELPTALLKRFLQGDD
jgi:putative transposase